jgi:D-psicose/D-tagatose/L-ribulose 3-epimerase
MRLAISNIAWNVADDEQIAELLIRYDIDAIDIAPGKYFPDLVNASTQDMMYVRDWWARRGIEITGMQALLFGTSGLNIFGSVESQQAMLNHLSAVCRIGSGIGATRLVFGSPKNRDRSGLDDQKALDIALPFFQRLGDIAQSFGVIICLEPNPPCYGANFMMNSIDTAKVVEFVAHPAIKMQFDSGALAINGEDADRVLKSYSRLIGHVHASEPDLLPLGDGSTDHRKVAIALQHYLPDYLVSIEMVATRNELPLISIERALQVAIKYYRAAEGIEL